ncbi:MAG: type II secretion system F family protein, partial [Gemmatimonadota bacterium]
MSGWKYRARTHDGDIRMGVVQAITEHEAMQTLVRDKLIPEWVKPAPTDEHFRLRRRANSKALSIFARQFATLIDAGVPLVFSLEILEELTDDKSLKTALGRARADVQKGLTLADAMRRHPRVFSEIFVNMVDAGEQAGVLDTILLRLAAHLEKSQATVSRVQTALVYPVIIVIVSLLAVAVLLTFVVPTFQQMFAAASLSLPYPTLVLVRSSEFLREHWLYLIVGGLLLVLFVRQLYETRVGRRLFDGLLLRLPLFGGLTRKAAIARFSRTLASLFGAGVNVLDALEVTARTTGNVVIESGIIRSRNAIAAGQGISGPLEATGVVPKLVARMVRVGEETGQLDSMLEKVADFYDREVDSAVEALLKAMEPAFVVVLGIVLGGMIVAMYLP